MSDRVLRPRPRPRRLPWSPHRDNDDKEHRSEKSKCRRPRKLSLLPENRDPSRQQHGEQEREPAAAHKKKKTKPALTSIKPPRSRAQAPAVALSVDQLLSNPKTIRDRKRNAAIIKGFNADHSDDVFQAVGNKVSQFNVQVSKLSIHLIYSISST